MINHVYWPEGSSNWGDALNPLLFELITGEVPISVCCHNPPQTANEHYMVIGSCMHFTTEQSIVWGAGCYADEPIIKPRKIHAVRGPHSRARLLNYGIDCPGVYGDPGLLFPRFYNPRSVEKIYELGIIPHFMDHKNPNLDKFKEMDNVIVINICDGIYKVVDMVLKCKRIVSSALHGLIVADAYNIPSLWIHLGVQHYWKFIDYFMSVGRYVVSPFDIDSSVDLDHILYQFCDYKINIDLDLLYNACPFKGK